MPVTSSVPGGPTWDQTCSSTPRASTPASRSSAANWSSMTGATASQTVFQATPSISASAETAMSWERSWPTAQAIARVVSLPRGAASSWTSLNVVTSQASSRQR